VNAARAKHRFAHDAHDAHAVLVRNCFRDIEAANEKPMGNVGIVGNSTHLHIAASTAWRNAAGCICKAGDVARMVGRRGQRMHVELIAPPHDQPLSRDEAARYLGVSRATMSCWATRRTGPRYSRSGKVRGRVWYRVRDLDAFIEARHVAVEARP
jgi:hypothetical protein